MVIQSFTIVGLVLLFSGQALGYEKSACEKLLGEKYDRKAAVGITRRPLGASVNINNEGNVPCSFYNISGQNLLHANCGGRVFALNDSTIEFASALDSTGAYFPIYTDLTSSIKSLCPKASEYASFIEIARRAAPKENKLLNLETSYLDVISYTRRGQIGKGGPVIKMTVLKLDGFYALPSKYQF